METSFWDYWECMTWVACCMLLLIYLLLCGSLCSYHLVVSWCSGMAPRGSVCFPGYLGNLHRTLLCTQYRKILPHPHLRILTWL